MREYSKSFTFEDIEKWLGTDPGVFHHLVISAPAGTGKTLAAKNYIAMHAGAHKIVYVAQTVKMLDDMKSFLINNGVESNKIFNFHGKDGEDNIGLSDSYGLSEKEITGRIQSDEVDVLLTTHARLIFESPDRMLAATKGKYSSSIKYKYDMVIMDECLTPIIVAKMSINSFEGIILKALKMDWDEYITTRKISVNDALEALLQYFYEDNLGSYQGIPRVLELNNLSIEVNDNTDEYFKYSSYKDNDLIEERLKSFYFTLSRQIVDRKVYKVDSEAKIILPLSIQFSWYEKVRNFLVLDATAQYSMGYFPGFEYVEGTKWNYDRVKHLYIRSVLDELSDGVSQISRTQLTNVTPEIFHRLIDGIDFHKYNKIYFSTFKNEGVLELVKNYVLKNLPEYELVTNNETSRSEKVVYVTNFGRTRGSNEFRDCDCVVQLGCLKFNPEVIKDFMILTQKVDKYSLESGSYEIKSITNDDVAMINFIQELYRSRIRLDKEIDCYLFCDRSFKNLVINQSLWNTIDIDEKLDELRNLRQLKRSLNQPKDYYGVGKYRKPFIDYINNCIELHEEKVYLENFRSYWYSITEDYFDLRNFLRSLDDLLVFKVNSKLLFKEEYTKFRELGYLSINYDNLESKLSEVKKLDISGAEVNLSFLDEPCKFQPE